MENRLISMTDKVIELSNNKNIMEIMEDKKGFENYWSKTFSYANFLKLPTKLEYFVPCDEDGNILEEPNKKHYQSLPNIAEAIWEYDNLLEQYEKALEKVLFEGFEVKSKNIISSGFEEILFLPFNNGNTQVYVTDFTKEKPEEMLCYTIEDLVKYNLTLTQNAINQIM